MITSQKTCATNDRNACAVLQNYVRFLAKSSHIRTSCVTFQMPVLFSGPLTQFSNSQTSQQTFVLPLLSSRVGIL